MRGGYQQTERPKEGEEEAEEEAEGYPKDRKAAPHLNTSM